MGNLFKIENYKLKDNYLVTKLRSYKVTKLRSYSVIQLFSYSVIQLFSYSVIQFLSSSVILFLCVSCAQQAHLTGGEMDTAPPVILNQEPQNYTTEFNSPDIRIYFDEYVELVNPSETFFISPPLKKQPEYVLKGKSLIINLNNELEKNVTYIITCGQGIKDLTEGNFLPLTSFVYSTGEYIDSLSLAGTVKDAVTLLPQEKIGVMLYKQDKDSALLSGMPYYYTLTDNNGNFMFTNIADGEYQLYALIDKNRNYLFDQSDEKIAFSDMPVKPIYIPPLVNKIDSLDTDSLKTDFSKIDTLTKASLEPDSTQKDTTIAPRIDYSQNTLMLFVEKDTSLRFMRRDFKGNYRHDFVFKNEITDFKLNQISNLDTLITYLTEYNKTKDTISVFFTAVSDNQIDFELFANQRLLDTLTFNPSQTGTTRRLSKKVDSTANHLMYNVITKGELHKEPCIRFDYPIEIFDLTKCTVVEERKNESDTLPIDCYFTDSNKRFLAFRYPFKEKTKYTVLCPDSVFFSYYGVCNDSIKIEFTTKTSKDYGAIRISYQFYEENNFIVQLLSDKAEVVQEDFITFNKSIVYNYLQAGKYRVRVIVDANNNQRWDSGNFLYRQQPEKIIYFEKTIDLQQNWRIEETFEVIFK